MSRQVGHFSKKTHDTKCQQNQREQNGRYSETTDYQTDFGTEIEDHEYATAGEEEFYRANNKDNDSEIALSDNEDYNSGCSWKSSTKKVLKQYYRNHGKPPPAPVYKKLTKNTSLEQLCGKNTPTDLAEVNEELQQINARLKEESQILRDRQETVRQKEAKIVDTERRLDAIIEEKVKERSAVREQELLLAIDHLENTLRDKINENKRLQENFNTIKASNDLLKKKTAALQSQYQQLEKQSQSLQARLQNLQRKQETSEKKDSSQDVKEKKIAIPKTKEKFDQPPQSKFKLALTQEVLTGLLEWLSEVHLRQYVTDLPTKDSCGSAECIQDKCIKTLPPLVELLKDSSNYNRKFILPCLQFVYWSLHYIEQSNHKHALTATVRRLGEELFRPRLPRQDSDMEPVPPEGFFFHSTDMHIRFLSSLLILKSITQADHIAQVFDVLRNDLKLDSGRELYLYYQATPAIVQHLKTNVKQAHSSTAIDIFLQLSMDSQQLKGFLDSCSTEGWFRAVASVWRAPGIDHKLMEKLSILLQKLSKIRSNRKYFEIFGFLTSAQEYLRTLGKDQETAFLALNLKSILYNYSQTKQKHLVSTEL